MATFKIMESVYGVVDFTKWWSGTQFANLSEMIFYCSSQGEQRIQGTSFTFDSQNTFKLGNGWKAELSGMYKSKVVSGVFTTKSYYMVSAGGQKDILKDRGHLNYWSMIFSEQTN
ncbi:hypothetical protein CS542_01530 [Pedobacter sp. IW39]|nr:hypothetical protein CS542_01530 [Pedobacter sp. IW39]